MAGFFGLFDYSKPGKGVDKDAPQKKRIFLFFELYFRKFWKLCALNLLYVLFCIPVVTIGPATAAMCAVLKNYAIERPVFLWSDFWEAFKENWKKGFAMGVIDALILVVAVVSIQFYYAQASANMFFYVPLFIVLCVAYITLLASAYMYVMIPILDMKFKPMLKNAFYLSVLGVKTNLITTLISVILVVVMVLFYPVTIIPAIVLFFSTFWFIITFNSFQYVEKYVINPYYEQNNEKRPDILHLDDVDDDEFVFEDIGTKEERPAQNRSSGQKGKTIK